jgi:hypothetical protein
MRLSGYANAFVQRLPTFFPAQRSALGTQTLFLQLSNACVSPGSRRRISYHKMDFGLTFGSVGDFISLTVLIKDIIAALDDARGSAKEYRALVQELVTLQLTLEAVQHTCEDPQFTHSLEDLAKVALDTVAHIKDCLSGFLRQIQKYEPALSAGASGKGNSLKAMGRKLQWKLNEKDVEKFRAEVMGCTMALKVLLEVITV